MKNLLLSSLLFLSFYVSTKANEKDPLTDIKISKQEILDMVKAMKGSGKITEAQFNATINDLEKMKQEDMDKLLETTKEMVRKDPDKAMEIARDKTLDINKVEQLRAPASKNHEDEI